MMYLVDNKTAFLILCFYSSGYKRTSINSFDSVSVHYAEEYDEKASVYQKLFILPRESQWFSIVLNSSLCEITNTSPTTMFVRDPCSAYPFYMPSQHPISSSISNISILLCRIPPVQLIAQTLLFCNLFHIRHSTLRSVPLCCRISKNLNKRLLSFCPFLTLSMTFFFIGLLVEQLVDDELTKYVCGQVNKKKKKDRNQDV
ncbi:hypothetical protein EDC96DRAFT_570098 [Choanephora cucurbitarum]|nr:hypothetical protein EDC96DRAFT_570098 [Choanephora cucurbitarum]